MLRRLFNIMQVYSQLTFACSADAANESSVLFKQELKDANNDELLLDDVESIDCRSVQTCMLLAIIFTSTKQEQKRKLFAEGEQNRRRNYNLAKRTKIKADIIVATAALMHTVQDNDGQIVSPIGI